MKHWRTFLLLGELGIQPCLAHEDLCWCTPTHIITQKRTCAASLKLWWQALVAANCKHTHRGTHTLICLGKQLHSHPTGKGSHSTGGPETISITNRTLGANQRKMKKGPPQSEPRENVIIFLPLPFGKDWQREITYFSRFTSFGPTRQWRYSTCAFLFLQVRRQGFNPPLRWHHTASLYGWVVQKFCASLSEKANYIIPFLVFLKRALPFCVTL